MTLHLDDRLLHGRILHGWGEKLGTRRYVLVSARLADPALKRSFAAVAGAAGCELTCLLPGEFPAGARDPEPDAFWLSDSAGSALALWRAGLAFERLVLIGLRDPDGDALAEDVRIGKASAGALDELLAAGVRVECRPFPTASATPYRAMGGPAGH